MASFGHSLGLPKDLFAGMDLMDMGAAAGGLLAATIIPNKIITTTDTTTKKILKVAVALGGAALAGFVFAKISPKSAKFAVAGGVAGALVQAIGAFTPIPISGNRMISAPRFVPMPTMGESRFEPAGSEGGIQVSVT